MTRVVNGCKYAVLVQVIVSVIKKLTIPGKLKSVSQTKTAERRT